MIAELVFYVGGKPRPAYVLDCLGNLVRCSAAGDPMALLPYAVELVSKTSDLLNPCPWTITVEGLVSRIRFVAEAVPDVLLAYPGVEPQKLRYPFVLPGTFLEDDTLIEQAIEMLPSLPAEAADSLRIKLADAGVFQIPKAPTFMELIHDAAGSGLTVPPLEEVSAGWMSSTRIYRKAVVRSA